MRSKTYLSLLAIAAALLLAYITMRAGQPGAAPRSAQPPSTERAQAPAANAGTGQSWFAARGTSPAHDDLPLSQQIDRLVATGKPEDLFKAYNLVEDCNEFKKWGTLPTLGLPWKHELTAEENRREAALCAGLTQRMQMSSIEHLAVAARAGVMGAAEAYWRKGPFGDPSALVTRPDDPLVVAWKQEAVALLTARASEGDAISLMMLEREYRYGGDVVQPDRALDFTYSLALQMIYQQIGVHSLAAFYDNGAREMEEGLSPQQVESGRRLASEIAERWKRRTNASRAQAKLPPLR